MGDPFIDVYGNAPLRTPFCKVVDQTKARAYYIARKRMGTKSLQTSQVGDSASYVNERSMVKDLCAVVTSRKGPVRCREVTCEFDYASGRADLVGVGYQDVLHAFETKISKWRQALDQARRNTCFAHYCYVALPERAATIALKAKEEFLRHGIGLVVLNREEARLAIRPRRNAPLLPWLTNVALSLLSPNHATEK